MKILFICEGNTCRSPLAEGIMKKKAAEKGVSLICESAGLRALSGDEASYDCIKAAEKLGVDLTSHRSRPFNLYMTDEYDLFVVMDENQKKTLSAHISEEKIHILSGGISDPCGTAEALVNCAEELEKGIDALIDSFTEIKIRPMEKRDVDEVAEVEQECFSQPWTKEGIESELSNDTARFLVAEQMGEIAGYLGMHIVLDECYIANIGTKQKYRRKGIANQLLESGEAKAKEEKCAFISLEVRVSNEKAIALYSKRGYNKIGIRKNFYSEPTENALIMTKDFQ